MQQSNRWKAAASLDLLLGTEHPPARITRDSATSLANADGSGVEARNSVSFRDTLYCNRQDIGYLGTRKRLTEYYRFMLSKIPLWEEEFQSNSTTKKEETDSSNVKSETIDEEISLPNDKMIQPLYRALGILTQTSDPGAIGDDLLLPWEFYPIMDPSDDDSYILPIKALTKEAAQISGLLHVDAENEEEGLNAAVSNTSIGNRSGDRISLYTRLVPQFTGIYPGMAIGIIGEPFKRSSSGILTGVLVRKFIFPSLPEFLWSIDRPIPVNTLPLPIPTRIHFCSGPFPRRDIPLILNSVTLNALSRGADLLIIGGPLVKEFEEFEKEYTANISQTFDELLGIYMDKIEETIDEYYAANSNPRIRHRLKVILIPHRDDVTQIPALPITMYALQEGKDVWVRSNPCRIAVNGVHIGVCNEDVIGDMRERMLERWGTGTGSLRRVVESLVQSRLYAPITELPAVKHELKHLHKLRMDYIPEDMSETERPTAALTWDTLFHTNTTNSLHVIEDGNEVKHEVKRMKQEEERINNNNGSLYTSSSSSSSVELMPHILFLPSTRPRFAVVTHRSVMNTERGTRIAETDIDDTNAASGVLVINQEIWSRRSSPRFELRVAELTIPDSERVVYRGASEKNGVSCGIIHFASSTATS